MSAYDLVVSLCLTHEAILCSQLQKFQLFPFVGGQSRTGPDAQRQIKSKVCSELALWSSGTQLGV